MNPHCFLIFQPRWSLLTRNAHMEGNNKHFWRTTVSFSVLFSSLSDCIPNQCFLQRPFFSRIRFLLSTRWNKQHLRLPSSGLHWCPTCFRRENEPVITLQTDYFSSNNQKSRDNCALSPVSRRGVFVVSRASCGSQWSGDMRFSSDPLTSDIRSRKQVVSFRNFNVHKPNWLI